MQLRDYQEEDVQFLLKRDASGIFNEQRTGKTPTAIITMERKNVSRLLIVCPASLVYVWAEEYTRWTGKTAHVVQSGTKFMDNPPADLKELPCVVCSYENLKGSSLNAGALDRIKGTYKPDGVILDEAHRIKDRQSRAAKAMFRLRNTKHKLALTGTPAPNKQEDIWSILHFLNPKEFSSYWGFLEEWFVMKSVCIPSGYKQEPSHIRKNLVTKFQNMLESTAIMRKRAEVMPWLPVMEEPTQIKLPLTPMQQKQIQEMRDYFTTGNLDAQNTLVQLVRIRQICGAPAMVGLKGISPKVEWVKQYVKDYPNKSIIIFSNSKLLLGLVDNVLSKSLLYTGDTPAVAKHAMVAAFQTGLEKVLLIQTQAGKEGLTLDRADVTIFLDTFPPAADYLQAKDRMVPVSKDRIKQQELIHVMMKGSYDEELYNLVANNVQEVDVINHFTKYLRRS